MPKLTQDFNIFPYFDDYDETKSFYKILFEVPPLSEKVVDA